MSRNRRVEAGSTWSDGAPVSAPAVDTLQKLFDFDWYNTIADLGLSEEDAFRHYLAEGVQRRISPTPYFSHDFYARFYADIRSAGVDPLKHYVEFGAREGRHPHPFFDPRTYLDAVGADPLAAANPLLDFVRRGSASGISPFLLFDAEWYAAQTTELGLKRSELYRHFVTKGFAENRSSHYLFDASFYMATNADVRAASIPAISHYMDVGASQGRWPHPFFDPVFYLSQLDDMVDTTAARVNPLIHFLMTGNRRGASLHPLFDYAYYCKCAQDVVAAGADPFKHFILSGVYEDRQSHPIFDAAYYRRANPDVVQSGMAMLWHYLAVGASEGRQPNALFDPKTYLRRLADRGEAASNPAVHFVQFGWRSETSPSAMFDYAWYKRTRPDVAASGRDGYLHFLAEGDAQQASPHPLFDPKFYLQQKPDLAGTRGPAQHFAEAGAVAGLDPNPLFDVGYYSAIYPDWRETTRNPIEHYLEYPSAPRRHPHPLFDEAHQAALWHRAHPWVQDSLSGYLTDRCSLSEEILRSGATKIPRPRRAILPSRRAPASLPTRPLISVLMPTYNSPVEFLKLAVTSVRSQSYDRWELILVDDCSTEPRMGQLLDELAATDDRIRLFKLARNQGISGATNHALDQAAGEYVALLDHDDVLLPHALMEVVSAFVERDADVVYTDQAFVSKWSTFEGAFYKPGWSPTLLTGVMYIGHLLAVRRRIAAEVRFDSRYDRLQDFEFMLRVSERTDKIVHVPEIQYYWRIIPSSIAFDAGVKGKIEPIQAEAVTAHLQRLGIRAEALPVADLIHRLTIRPLPRSDYPKIDVVIVSDGASTSDQALQAALDRPSIAQAVSRVTRVGPGTERAGTREGEGDDRQSLGTALEAGCSPYIVLLEGAAVIENERWLDYLLMYAEQDDVALVGAHSFTSDGTAIAAGLIAEPRSGLIAASAGARYGDDGYAGSLACDREVTAPAPGMVLIKRSILARIGTVDADFLSTTYAIGELAFRARAAGFRNISIATRLFSLPEAHGSWSETPSIDRLLFADIHARELESGDRYYSRNFEKNRGNYS